MTWLLADSADRLVTLFIPLGILATAPASALFTAVAASGRRAAGARAEYSAISTPVSDAATGPLAPVGSPVVSFVRYQHITREFPFFQQLSTPCGYPGFNIQKIARRFSL